ncbi:uncharacterized protein N7518_009737 [Penicillium psychrosexuale]|uniref:uncharacterized protein n=1 Tax=Penicillium psychrosexuale TaxID=1002107 RepID=UPI002544F1EE|nr:uncharacterized protein N7518_009737 [Penicillium psychrosexuale]KAJ5784060.1 hypothetical protein N7518_009737 [Penicillium psychrosexuale]
MSSTTTSTDIPPSLLEAGLEKKDDSMVVDWDGPEDRENPRNWSPLKRWAHVVIISILALITNMAPTMCAPGAKDIAADLHITSTVVSTLTITLYVLGIAIGPMFMSPLSEMYGRVPVYHGATIIFVAFIIGNALSKTTSQFMVFRFISGCAGGTPMALGGGTIADITSVQQRDVAMALFSMGPLAGPVLGPVIGGFLAAGSVGLSGFLPSWAVFLAPSPCFFCGKHIPSILTSRQVLRQVLVRPVILLVRSPILFVISLYVALVFGVMYLLFTTFTSVFEGQYGFSTSISGLTYLGLGVVLVISMVLFNLLNGHVQAARMKAEGVHQPRPEYRLLLMIWFSPFVAGGLFLYGWTAYYKVHWIVPILGTSLMGFGTFFVITPAQLYLIDVFGSEAAASALGASNLLRYISSTFLPLAGPSMYSSLNYGWGNSVLGLIVLAFVPAPVLFYKYGERLRTKKTIV